MIRRSSRASTQLRSSLVSVMGVALVAFIAPSAVAQPTPIQAFPYPVYQPAEIQELAVTLTPTLPNYFNQASPTATPLRQYRVTIGDLNADGVPDLVFSNAVAFLRVYWMTVSGGVWQPYGHHDPLPYGNWPTSPPVCSTTGAGARYLSTTPWGMDAPIIHDIDLDGDNDLIYLDHISNKNNDGDVTIQVYEHQIVGLEEHLVRQPHNAATQIQGLHQISKPYFAPNCNTQKGGGHTYRMAIANVRGRAFPQDIVVWTGGPPNNVAVQVYAYDTNGGTSPPSITQLFPWGPWMNPAASLPEQGDPGHTWAAADIDFDNREEIIGKHVLGWDPVAASPVFRWGMVFAGDLSIHSGYNVHPDHHFTLDFLDSYVDEAGDVVPAPGVEVLVAPQTATTSGHTTDPSGPWIYRALSGHQTHLTPPRRTWPRKVINRHFGVDGADYEFPSPDPATSIPWNMPEPDPMADNPSLWEELGSSFGGGENDPNTQGVIPVELLFDDSGPGGTDLHPGPELLAVSKAWLNNESGCGTGNVHYVFDSTNSLAAVAWASSTSEVRGPTIHMTKVLDLWKGKRALEVASLVGVGQDCPDLKLALMRWKKASAAAAPKRFEVDVLWERTLMPGELLGAQDGTTVYDVMGDAREEFIFFRNSQGGPEPYYHLSEIILVRQNRGVPREDPSPDAFLDYRRSRSGSRTAPYVDQAALTGLRLTRDHLTPGTVGQPYGVVQDLDLEAGGPQVVGETITAEGGVPPYWMSVADGVLPEGMSSRPLAVASPYGSGLLFEGTPTEDGVRRITVRVTDSDNPPTTVDQDYWITIDAGGAPSTDKAPRVVAASFGGVYLTADTPTDLTVDAWVDDLDGDVTAVKLYDEGGTQIAALAPQGGNLYSTTITGYTQPAGVTHMTIRAEDAALHVSNPWPYVVVDGGPGQQAPIFQPEETHPGQDASNTPTIDRLEITQLDLPAGEVSDASGQIDFTIDIDRKGLPLGAILVRLRHPLTAETRYSQVVLPGSPTADTHNVTLTLPGGEVGWGWYGLNVQLITLGVGNQRFYSDWWPQLQAH